MEPKEVFDELKTMLVARLKFDPRRAAEVVQATPLPKGVEDSIGLDWRIASSRTISRRWMYFGQFP